MQASGRSVATWPDDIVTRLAHVDATTARYLIDAERVQDADAREGLGAIRAMEKWILDRLTSAERAEIQELALMIRIEDSELESPLLRPEAPAEDSASHRLTMKSLRAGIAGLTDAELAQVAQRLGIPSAHECTRSSLENQVQSTLRDDHLLGILLATLTLSAHKLLAALVRQRFEDSSRSTRSSRSEVSASGKEPLQQLRDCGLVYRSKSKNPPEDLWVPVELQRRLDGVLRAFGV